MASNLGSLRGIRGLVRSDLQNIRRDSLSIFMAIYPFILAVVMRWLLPVATDGLSVRFGLDLSEYNPLILTFFGLLVMPALFGTVLGFLMLDERDDNTIVAIQVTPLSTAGFFGYRLLQPMLLTIIGTLVIVPIINIYDVPLWQLLPIALVSALGAPIYGLLLASLANNKVQGLAVSKGLGALLVGPILAWFVDVPWQWLFGILPNYWSAKALWLLLDGEPFWGYLLIGVVVSLLWVWIFFRRFRHIIYR